MAALCGHLSSLTEVATPRLESWLRYLVIGMFQGGDGVDEDTLQENRLLLQSLTTSIVGPGSGVPESVPLSILSLLTSLASELLSPLPSLPTVGFPDLVMVMGSLAMAGGGRGHLGSAAARLGGFQRSELMVQHSVGCLSVIMAGRNISPLCSLLKPPPRSSKPCWGNTA